MRTSIKTTLLIGLLSLSACTDPGETTGIGAAAGGVVGASLGAIVGSATGDAGTGLVLGAVAGSATGAAVGNVLEAQQQTIRTQDEAIERHERMIAAQTNEIRELRKIGGDTAVSRLPQRDDSRGAVDSEALGSLRPGQQARSVGSSSTQAARVAAESTRNIVVERDATHANTPKLTSRSEVRERSLVETEPQAALRSSFEGRESRAQVGALQNHDSIRSAADVTGSGVGAIVSEPVKSGSSPECVQAGGEYDKAQTSTELADKLFHLRRALRLCPENAGYHNKLGEVYMALNRRADAEFEFREALRQQPGMAAAQANLNALK
ncbi:MAG: hypothetical protein K1X79_12010 [Oligoflexia bacterium]|nr:hypothetical protein [Oligoflexia bacterium]